MPDAGGRRSTEDGAPRRRVAVWDLPTRLFHWVLVILIVALWITGTDGPLDLHVKVGEALLALLMFRFGWGFFGSRHSRFRDFIVGPRAVRDHLNEIVRIAVHGPKGDRGQAPHVGHTRLGGWMIVALLGVIFVQCVTGLFATDDISVDGPLNKFVGGSSGRLLTAIHDALFNIILVLAAIHISAALFYLLRKRENLILPLITGRADLPPEIAVREGRFASPWLALALLLAAAAAVWAISSL